MCVCVFCRLCNAFYVCLCFSVAQIVIDVCVFFCRSCNDIYVCVKDVFDVCLCLHSVCVCIHTACVCVCMCEGLL